MTQAVASAERESDPRAQFASTVLRRALVLDLRLLAYPDLAGHRAAMARYRQALRSFDALAHPTRVPG